MKKYLDWYNIDENKNQKFPTSQKRKSGGNKQKFPASRRRKSGGYKDHCMQYTNSKVIDAANYPIVMTRFYQKNN